MNKLSTHDYTYATFVKRTTFLFSRNLFLLYQEFLNKKYRTIITSTNIHTYSHSFHSFFLMFAQVESTNRVYT